MEKIIQAKVDHRVGHVSSGDGGLVMTSERWRGMNDKCAPESIIIMHIIYCTYVFYIVCIHIHTQYDGMALRMEDSKDCYETNVHSTLRVEICQSCLK
jgi:hypothetical protein